jgi:hypothetical protein
MYWRVVNVGQERASNQQQARTGVNADWVHWEWRRFIRVAMLAQMPCQQLVIGSSRRLAAPNMLRCPSWLVCCHDCNRLKSTR